MSSVFLKIRLLYLRMRFRSLRKKLLVRIIRRPAIPAR